MKCELQNLTREAGACTYRPDDTYGLPCIISSLVEIIFKSYFAEWVIVIAKHGNLRGRETM
jgi:hypothetical protein